MNSTARNIKQRLSMREPLCEALDVVVKIADTMSLSKPPVNIEEQGSAPSKHAEFIDSELATAKSIFPHCKSFERDFPSFAFSIATGIGKTRLMAACIAYLYLNKGIKNFFVLAPNLTLYEKLIQDFGNTAYSKYAFKGIAEFVHNPPIIINGDNYEQHKGSQSLFGIRINIFNIAKFNSDSKESKKGAPKMKRLSEYLGQSYFNYLAELDDLVVLMDEAHRYHANSSKKAINELRPVLGLEMTATPTDEKGKAFKNIVYEYNLAQALTDGKYVKIPTVAKRKNFQKENLSETELDTLKIDDAINLHEQTKTHLELYALNNNKPIVKPFILVVCKSIQHAKDTLDLIENDLFDGRYKGKVLQIDSSTKRDEEIDNLFLSLENYDNKIEIVIHVNMLKEGWDVTNLYTIVPLRAADAPILVEQSIGRGLRLPYGGRRTGDKNVDKLTVIAHENFEAVITKAKDPNSVLSKFSFIELDDEDFKQEPSRVVPAQTRVDLQEKKAIEAAKTEIERKSAQVTSDAQRAVWKVIPQMNVAIKNKEELAQPQVIKTIKELAIREIEKSARESNPLFAAEESAEKIKEVEKVVNLVVRDFIENIIEIPRMTVMNEVYKAEFKWFDLDTHIGFNLHSLDEEIVRVNIGAGEQDFEIIQIKTGRKFALPRDEIVSVLIDFDEVDYDDNAELLYHLTDQALEAIASNLDDERDLAKVVSDFKRGIVRNIYDQMMRHFTITSQGYQRPNVLPFVGIVEQNLREIEGYGYIDFREVIAAGVVRKFIYTGFLKSYYTQCKFDSKTEQDFAIVLETDSNVLRWLRPAPTQFNIYWLNGSKKYEPDFVVETSDCIYLLETKAAKDVTAEDVVAKKIAAEEYCKHASEYTLANGGKPWEYRVISHIDVDRTHSLEYILSKS